MFDRISFLGEKKLIGKSIKMNLADNKTLELWRSFMPLVKDIQHAKSSKLFSIQIYNEALHFNDFNLKTDFTKWAAIEVPNFNNVPSKLQTYILPSGLYAVFIHQGFASEFKQSFDSIFGKWLPQSIYNLDSRPHFELLGDKYSNNNQNSEEEIWIPIILKSGSRSY